MMFLKLKLKRLRRESTPAPAFKAALRAQLTGTQPLIVHRFPTPMLRYAMVGSALVVMIFFGTTSYAYASSSVTEGDALYPVKTKIETLEAGLKKSPEAQARFRARMLERRAREIVYRLRHNQPLRPQDIATISRAMNMSVEELKEVSQDQEGRNLVKTELKLRLTNSLTEFRTRVELSDMDQEHKDKYLRLIDMRLRRIQDIPTAAPLE
jgi:AraC-like DNA-binding protein